MKRALLAALLALAFADSGRAVELPLEEDEALRVIEAVTTRPPARLPHSLWLLPPLLAAGALAAVWWTVGRDRPVKQAIDVRYEAPRGLTPAEVGVLVDEHVDVRDVTSTLLDLAARGYVAVEPVKDGDKGPVDYELRRAKAPDETLRAHELQMFATVFGAMPSVRLSEMRGALAAKLGDFRRALYRTVADGGLFHGAPSEIRGAVTNIGAGIAAAGATVGGLMAFPNPYAALGAGAVAFLALSTLTPGEGLFATLVGGAAALATALGAAYLDVPPAARIALSAASVGAVVAASAPWMPVRTAEGRRAYEELLGFREFLDRVEANRLALWNAEPGGPERIERMLAYAMALGCEKRWEGALASAFHPSRLATYDQVMTSALDRFLGAWTASLDLAYYDPLLNPNVRWSGWRR